MNDVDYRTYKLLSEEKSISLSMMPKSVLKSDAFGNLIRSAIIEKVKQGRGFVFRLRKEDAFNKFFTTNFPTDSVSRTKSGNIKKYRNSKARVVETKPIFLLRGFQSYVINDRNVNIKKHTIEFGLFSVIPEMVSAPRICFVENLETFLNVEKLLGDNYLYLHKYGRIGKNSISMIEADEILVFVDYDFNGLDEFLRIKNVFPSATLYIPRDYQEIFKKYSVSLKGNRAKMSKSVKNSTDPDVVLIREQVARTNRFLEQEILINV